MLNGKEFVGVPITYNWMGHRSFNTKNVFRKCQLSTYIFLAASKYWKTNLYINIIYWTIILFPHTYIWEKINWNIHKNLHFHSTRFQSKLLHIPSSLSAPRSLLLTYAYPCTSEILLLLLLPALTLSVCRPSPVSRVGAGGRDQDQILLGWKQSLFICQPGRRSRAKFNRRRTCCLFILVIIINRMKVN